ncbi:MAG: LysM peptidoglycan-binding domain-containing protein [Acidobacteriota bacterium]|nr:LysM peptidoglycan-binding domain-containing protein [Acidobacteriota bacterium]MDH3523209.1 LysM peptidoglycan-binding domain-containing protein [Acidobacteriota bacterium]
MITKDSRYASAQLFKGESGADPDFPGIRPRVIGKATGVVEHTVKQGDRLDLLARNYYNDDRLWWRIVDANPEFLHAGDVVRELPLVLESGRAVEVEKSTAGVPELAPSMVGRVILIPRARE